MQDADEVARLALRAGLALDAERAEVVARAFAELWPGLEALNRVDVGGVEPALTFDHNAVSARGPR